MLNLTSSACSKKWMPTNESVVCEDIKCTKVFGRQLLEKDWMCYSPVQLWLYTILKIASLWDLGVHLFVQNSKRDIVVLMTSNKAD